MKQTLILIFCFLMTCCTTTIPVTVESKEIRTNVAATKDAIDAARFDLAEQYSNNLSALSTPPATENRISIKPIYKDGKLVVAIPNKFKDENIIAVGTAEWNNLLKLKDIVAQLANDSTNLNNEVLKAREEITKQQQIKEQLAANNVALTQEIQDAKHTLIKRNILIASLLTVIGGYFFLKFRGILPI